MKKKLLLQHYYILFNNRLRLIMMSLLCITTIQQSEAWGLKSTMDIKKITPGSYDFTVVWHSGNYYQHTRRTWDFGDGTVATGQINPIYKFGVMFNGQASHAYSIEGKYKVSLFLWDSITKSADTISASICYINPKVNPGFSLSGKTISCSATCKTNQVCFWDFNNGSYGQGCSITHTYKKAGFYRPILLSVKDTITGCSDTFISTSAPGLFNLAPCGFASDFKISSGYGNAYVQGLPYTIRPGTISGNEIWQWGDGTQVKKNFISNYSQDNHHYSKPGNYNICHILSDSGSLCADTTCKNLFRDTCRAKGDFNYSITGKDVFFNAKTNGTHHNWDVGGNISKYSASNSYASLFIEYETFGKYKVCMGIALDYCIDTVCKTIMVPGCDIQFRISYTADSFNCRKVRFTNATFGNKVLFKWDFGDSTFSNLKDPFHSFKKTGYQKVKVVAFDTVILGCKDSSTFMYYVNCNPPPCGVYDSLVLDYDSTQPYQATLNNYSVGNIHKHYWDFGDGNTSTSASPVHIYSISGPIVLIYVATDTIKGCSDTTVIKFTIDSMGNIKRRAFVLNVVTHKNNTSVKLAKFNALHVFPNPFNKEIILTGNYFEEITEIILLNDLGQKIKLSYTIEKDKCIIDTEEGINKGIYLLKVKSGEAFVLCKLLKE